MKKILAILALTFAVSANALTAGLSYDYDRANGAVHDVGTTTKIALSQGTAIGTFGGALLATRHNRAGYGDDANGFELGYSNQLNVKAVTLRGRLAYGRVNNIDPSGGGFTGHVSYYSAGIEAATALTPTASAFVGYRYGNSLNIVTSPQRRYIAGVDYALTKQLAIRAALTHTTQNGLIYNGISTAISYGF